MKRIDRQILETIQDYRESVQDRHGPVSLDELGSELERKFGKGRTKSALSVRLRKLWRADYLEGSYIFGRLQTYSLRVSPKGIQALSGGDDGQGMEGEREASG